MEPSKIHIMKIPKHIDTKEEAITLCLQIGLKELGFDPRGADGMRGPNTEVAIRRLVASLTPAYRISTPPLPKYAAIAHSYIGEREVRGTKSNPLILGWIRKVLGWGDDDSKIAWCAIFINIVLTEAGLKGTGKANARSFEKWGSKVTVPRKGDIVVFSRGDPNGWQGHVGIYMGEAGSGKIYCLGGNQRDQVSIAKYNDSRVLSYRRAE